MSNHCFPGLYLEASSLRAYGLELRKDLKNVMDQLTAKMSSAVRLTYSCCKVVDKKATVREYRRALARADGRHRTDQTIAGAIKERVNYTQDKSLPAELREDVAETK